MYSKNGKTGLILFVLAALILITLSCDKLLPEREVNNPLDPTNPNIPVQDSIGVLEVDGTIWVGQPARMYIRFSEVFGSASAKLQALYQINSDANVSDTLISPLQQILETDTLLAAMLELHHNKTGGDFSLRAFWIDNFDNSDSSAALPATIDTRAPWITSDAREVWPNPMERARWALGVEHTITLVALDGYSQSSPKMPALYPGVGVDADLAYLVFLDDEDRELSELRFREIELGNWLENLAVPGDLLEDSADFIAFELDFSVLSDMTEILSQTENVMIRVGDILGNFREDKYVPIFDLDRASISLQGDGIESGTAFSDTLAFHVEITDDDAVSDNIKYLSAINIYASTEYNDSIYYFSYDPIHPILGDTTLISFNDNLNRYELNFDVFWRWHHVTDLGEGTHDMTITVEVVDVAGDTTISSPILQFENLMQGLDGLEDLIDFGTVKIGEVYRDTITITNLSTFEVRIENVRSSEPSVLNLDFTDPVILDDDDSLEVPVSFTPTEEDPEFTAILNVDWSDPNEENGLRTIFTERTTGFFTALVDNPDLVVETGDLDWEWVGFSDSTQIDSFILSNTGEVDLEISNVSSSNPGVFRLEDANVPYTIAPDGTWDIQVTFLPDHAANFVADLSIESDDPDGVHVESGFFRGIGEPMTYTLEPALMNMGIITSDATSHDTIIIANTSHIEIEFDTVYSNTTEFFIDNEFPEDLRLDPLIDGDDPDYIELPVEFHSPDDGAYIGDLIVQWDDFPLMTGGSNGDNSLFNAKPRSSARNTKITATRKSDNRKLSISNSKRTDRKRRGPAIQKQSRDGINRLSGQQRKQRPTALEMIREAGGINDGFELDETGMDTHTNYFTGIVGSPEVVFHPTLVNFEVIEVNATGLDSFEIENQSNNILNVDSILFDDPHFVLTGEYDFELQPNTSQVCYVEFTPTEPITYRGTIQLILDNPPDTTEEIPYLSGIGGESRMELSPTLLSFGVVDVGATDTIRFVIQNEGRWPLQVNSFDVEVDTSVVDTNGWAANGLFIADIFDREVIAMPQIIGVDEESNSIYVAFVPPRDTDFAAQLIIDSNDPASPHTLDFFTGTGARGHYRFDPTILSYGVVERGIESPELTFWMYNSGLDLLEVGGMSSDDGLGIFTITSEHVDPFEIPANDSTQVSATFTPPGAHDYTANLEFDEVSIPFFSGTGGFPRIGLTPASYNYGVVAIHENETHTFRITNNGLTNLVLDDITSNDPVLLEVDWAGEETVLPQAFFDFDATFSPLVRGVHNFDLIISYNTFEELTVDDYFSGFGGSGLINLSPGLLGFGLQSANTFRIETFTIINEGETDLDITGFAISDNDEDNIIFDFVGDPGTPTIPSEGSVDIDIIFSPANPVDYTGTVTISSDHPGVEEIELNLTGTGSSARMRLSPLQLSYGSVEVDEDSIRTFVIYNDGEQVDLEIIEILTGDPDIFVIVDPDIEDIPPGESSDPIEVRFQPDDDRQYVENLFINTNANDIDIPFFTGTGGIPVIGLEPTMLDFGLVAFRFGNNRTLSFDIANNGAVEVTLDSLVSNHVSFVPNDNAFPIDMDAGESREINATFTPIELGVHQATLTIYSEDLDDPYVVNYFTGLGGIGEISVTPGNLNYGIIELREDDTDYFRIHNRGAVDVSILNFASSNPDIFQIVGYDFPIDIAADDSFRVNVTFEPEDAENYFGHLEISSDWGDETYQNFFTGTGGEPHIDLRPALINFGSVEVGDDETRNFELWNDGTYELVVDNMTTGHDDFTITTVTEFTLPVGEYRTIFVDFEPSLPQLYAVDLTIDVVSQTYDDYTVEFLYGSGAEAIADVDPHVVDFGEVVVGESSTESFEVQNDGTVALTVTAITLNNEVYEVLTATPFTVQPEATYQVNVEFTPPFSGTYLADLSIQSNDPDSPLEILEFCTGLGWASEIEIDPEDGVLDYGNVDIDSTEEMTFDVINHGNATLSVTSIVISGDDPDYFTVDGPTSFDITAGGTNTVTIEFNPLDPVDYFADLTINCDDPNNPTIEFDDNLIGTGWGPVIVIDPDSDIPYGNVLVDRDSTRSFDIENNGNEDFTVTDVYSSEGVFEVVNGTEFTLVAGGDPRTVNITFSPLARQFHSGELTIASDEIDDLVYDNYFSGTGRQPVISLDPEQEVNFGDVLVDRDSTMEFDIVNDGDWTYSVTNITSSEGAFTITSDTEFSLPAHNSETIEVMFSPTATQDYAGTLTIESDEIADEITVDFFVGTGRQPDITILPDPQLDYGDVLVDRDSSRSFTITNQGDWDLTITDISSFDGAYAITSDTAIVVESDGGRQTVHVLFSPLVAREFPSTLTVVSDEIADIVMDDFFTGFGRIPEISLDPDPFLSFGDVLVDRDSTSSFVITNGGDWDFNVTDITSSENGYTILGETDFTVTADGGEHEVSVRFSPTVQQEYLGILTIQSIEIADIVIGDDEGEDEYFFGTGRIPVISLDPDVVLPFDVVLVDTDSTLSFDVENTGDWDFTVSDITFTNDAFTIVPSSDSAFIVGALETFTVDVMFSPLASQDYTGSMTIISDEIADIDRVDYFEGEGRQPVISLDPVDALAFDIVLVGVDSTVSFDIINDGNANYTVTDVTSSEGVFTVTNGTSFTVTPNDTHTVNIEFSPVAATDYLGTLTIESVEIVDIVETDYFTGTGTQPDISLDPVSELAFDSVLVDTDSTLSFDITNGGDANFTVEDINSSEGAFTFESDTAFVVGPGETVTVDVMFSPTVRQVYAGDLTIVSVEIDDIVMDDYFTGDGRQPVISFDPVDLAFGEELVDFDHDLSFDIVNDGNANLTVTSITSDEGTFTITNGTDFTVSPYTSHTVDIRFSPLASQAYSGTLTIVSTEIADIVEADYFTGTGIQPVIALDPVDEVSFGSVLVSTNGIATFDINNSGDADLTVTDVTSSDDAFTITSGTAFTVTAGGSEEVTVWFSPTAAQAYTGTLTIVSDEIDDIVEADYFTGTGIEPVITLDPLNEVDFGDVLVDFNGNATFDIDNTGDADFTVYDVASSDGAFSVTNGTVFTVDANSSRTVNVRFSPTAAGDYTGTLTITSEEIDDIVEVDYFVGTGIEPVITLNPLNELAFGDELVDFSNTLSFDIDNNGDADYTVTSVTSSEGVFTITNGTAFVVSAGGSHTVDVLFSPTVAQDYTGTLTIVGDELVDDIVETDYFTGTGVQPEITLDPLLVDGGLAFGYVLINTESDVSTFDIVNGGDADLTITDMTSSEDAFVIDYDFDVDGDITVPANTGTVTIDVTFNPTAIQDYTGTLTIVSDELVDDIVETDYFTGTGAEPVIVVDPLLVDGGLEFGGVEVDTDDELTFDIVNSGFADLTITSLTSTGAFVITPGYETTVPANDGDTDGFVTITVTFGPTVGGGQTYAGTLTIDSEELTDIVETDYFTGTGTGGTPGISVSPLLGDGGLAFGDVAVDTDDELTFDIVNSGNTDLTITSITTTGEFVITPGYTTTVPANNGAVDGSVTVTVTFSPTVGGGRTFAGTLTIDSEELDDIVETDYFTGTGTGGAVDIALTPLLADGGLEFGDQAVDTDEELTFDIVNSGNADLTITSITSTIGDGADAFVITPGYETTVLANDGTGDGSVTITVTFSPIVGGGQTYAGTLTIDSEEIADIVETDYFTGTGTGGTPDIVLSPLLADGGLEFGDQAVDTDEELTFDIVNSGNTDLTITSITSSDGAFVITPGYTTTVPANDGSVTITATFSPIVGGGQTYAGTLTIDSEELTDIVETDYFTGTGTGGSAVIALTPLLADGGLEFGDQAVDTDEELTFDIVNSGNADLTITSITSSIGDGADAFVITPGYTTTVPANDGVDDGTVTVTVTFSPTVGGGQTYAGTLTIDSEELVDIVETDYFTGTGTGGSPVITLTPLLADGGLEFGDQAVDTDEELTFDIVNIGNADLTITTITSTIGDGADAFVITPGYETTVPANDGVDDGTVTITVTFSPTVGGGRTYAGTLTIDSEEIADIVETDYFTGTGTGGAAAAVLDPDLNLDFGAVGVDVTSPLSFTIENTGNADLHVTDITAVDDDGDGVFVPQTTTVTVLAGDTETINVDFTPIAAVDYDGILTIVSTELDDIVRGATDDGYFTGTGTGTPDIALSPLLADGGLEFGDVAVDTDLELTFDIVNSGTGDLTITSITSSDDAFVITPGYTTTVPANDGADDGSVTVTVTFSPTVGGGRTFAGTLTIDSEELVDIVETDYFTGTGTGGSPTIALSPLLVDGGLEFGDQAVDTDEELTFDIVNSGNADLTITTITSTIGDGADAFVITPGYETTVPANDGVDDGSVTITVTFSPTVGGGRTYAGTLTVDSEELIDIVETDYFTGAGTGGAAAAVLNPDLNLDYGEVEVDATSPLSFTIENTGNADLHVTNITAVDDDGDDVFVPQVTTETVLAGATETINVDFTPIATVDYDGILTIVSTELDDIVRGVTDDGYFTGIGTGTPIIALSPLLGDGGLAFGDIAVDTDDEQTFDIVNSGNADLTITSITSSDGAFVITPGYTTTVSANDGAVDGSVTITVTFSPTVGGGREYDGTLTIDSEELIDVVETDYFTGNGTGGAAAATLTPDLNLDFGTVTIGEDLTLSFTIENTGNADLHVSDITSSDGVYVPDVTTPLVLAGETETINVTFTPLAAQVYPATLTISSVELADIERVGYFTGTGQEP